MKLAIGRPDTETVIPLSAEPRRILIVKLSSLGDILHALPAAVALRDRFPKSWICWLVDERFGSILDGHPAVDQVILARASRRLSGLWGESYWRAAAQYAIGPRLARERFDLVIDMQGLFRTGVFTAATGAPVRAGLASAREGAPLFYTHCVRGDQPHAVERCFALARALGAKGPIPKFGLSPSPAGKLAAERLLASLAIRRPSGYAVFAVRTSRPNKDWNVAGFAEVARELLHRHALSSLIIGGTADRADADRVSELSNGAARSVAGLPMETSIGLLAGARLFLGNDSGPLHLAVALDRPVVAIFGPTDPARTGPWGQWDHVVRQNDDCRGCQLVRRAPFSWIGPAAPLPHTCLQSVSPRLVLEKVEQALNRADAA